MGEIGGEELKRWDNMRGGITGREEKILVLVRLRPLTEKDIARNEVADWECINDTTILYRNSLQERSGLPTAYTFDRVFSGDCSTKQVYEEATKEIALSVVSGINSSIFAYGQTSSGKTYTMTGITEYTVADIYDYIQRHEERAFVLKFSAIEIYNENVRDLLSTDSTPLRLLDDPERGTLVEKLTEESLMDWGHLKKLLSICDAQRKIGETSLNETSSRSHQILRLTVESSAREFIGKENSSTLSASVFFIDLAGSERASQAVSAGTRLKEGCHINRSLLTLGNVIRKLSKGRHGHVNYRDSKLTRILQPCLGGNARTTIICTLSPARSHVEQSRNTLLFASCAKEVTTNAQVNVVMSDKALVKHLQKELARLESELRSPAPTSSSCHCSVLLRKRDLQIEKMEKEIRELNKQRNLAQSRVEDLLQLIGNGQDSNKQEGHMHHLNWEAEDRWEDEGSGSEISDIDHHFRDKGVRNFNSAQSSHGDGRSLTEQPCSQPIENSESHSVVDGPYSSLSIGSEFIKSDQLKGEDEITSVVREDPDDHCKEVRCVEMGKTNDARRIVSAAGQNGQILASNVFGNGHAANQETPTGSPHQNGFSYGALERRILDVQRTIESLASPSHDQSGPWGMAADTISSRSLKFTRSQSCRENLTIDSPTPFFGREDYFERTPPTEFEKDFLGKAGVFRRKLPPLDYGVNSTKLSMDGSQSSVGTNITDDLKSQSSKKIADEDIPSVTTFVSGLEDAKLQYEKQLEDSQVWETGAEPDELRKTVRDVALDPKLGTQETTDWPQQFEMLRRSIIELWQTCNVSLVHRTYFFLLFKGDPTDSIYLEVELRRLSFLKGTFSLGNQAVEGGQAKTLASSVKALRREREMLSKLINRRFCVEERKRLYQKWGIELESKRRRLQLVCCLWTDPKDLIHIAESAAVVAKLVEFSEQGRALKEMFGLSFTPPIAMTRRSHSWK